MLRASEMADVKLCTHNMEIELSGKLYRLTWGKEGVQIHSNDKVKVVKQSKEGYWLVVK